MIRLVLLVAFAYLVVVPAAVLISKGRRAAVDRLFTSLAWGSFLLALVPLVAVVGLVVKRGLARFDVDFLDALDERRRPARHATAVPTTRSSARWSKWAWPA